MDPGDQFRGQFRFQPEEAVQKPPEVPDAVAYEDIPQIVNRRGFERDTGQGYLFSVRSNEARSKMYIRANREGWRARNNQAARYQEAQAALADRSTGQQISKAHPIEQWPQPGAVEQHGEYHVASFPGGIAAFHGDQPVGRLQITRPLSHGTRYVDMVEVNPEHQRRGLASAMWRQAQETYQEPVSHSPKRTEKGDAWAKAVGGRGI